MLHLFVYQTRKEFSKAAMTYNVHQLLHLASSVANWGPLFEQSTFSFEAANHDLLQAIHCANGVNLQIARFISIQRTCLTIEQIVYPVASPLVPTFAWVNLLHSDPWECMWEFIWGHILLTMCLPMRVPLCIFSIGQIRDKDEKPPNLLPSIQANEREQKTGINIPYTIPTPPIFQQSLYPSVESFGSLQASEKNELEKQSAHLNRLSQLSINDTIVKQLYRSLEELQTEQAIKEKQQNKQKKTHASCDNLPQMLCTIQPINRCQVKHKISSEIQETTEKKFKSMENVVVPPSSTMLNLFPKLSKDQRYRKNKKEIESSMMDELSSCYDTDNLRRDYVPVKVEKNRHVEYRKRKKNDDMYKEKEKKRHQISRQQKKQNLESNSLEEEFRESEKQWYRKSEKQRHREYRDRLLQNQLDDSTNFMNNAINFRNNEQQNTNVKEKYIVTETDKNIDGAVINSIHVQEECNQTPQVIQENTKNYSNFERHVRVRNEFEKKFINNPFGKACTVCDRLWFKADLKKINGHEMLMKKITNLQDASEAMVCSTCKRAIDNDKIPNFAVYNGFNSQNYHLTYQNLIL
ncbi:hypothetical protein TKK_0015404 [Trichogramma kaykai]